jgi:hypothetical protein
MAVNVHIPICVRLDATALEREDDVNEAVQAGARRALDHSHRQVLAPRDHYLEVKLREPEFSWSGLALEAATAQQRSRIEARVREAIDAALRASKVTAHMQKRRNVAAPLTEPAAEARDRTRFHPLGYYAVPSYDEGGEQIMLPVQGKDDLPAGRVITQWPQMPAGWFDRLSSAAQTQAVIDALGGVGITPDFGNGCYGLLWWEPSDPKYPVHFFVVTRELRRFSFWSGLFPFRKLVHIPTGAKFEEHEGLPEFGLITAEWWTAEMVRSDYRRWLEEQVGSLQRPEQLSVDDFIQANKSFIDENVDMAANKSADSLVLSAPGSTLYLDMPETARRWTGIAYLAPIARTALDFSEIDPSKAAGGGAGEAQSEGADPIQGRGAGKRDRTGQGEGGGRKGGYIYGGDEGREGEFAFPRPKAAIGVELVCDSFDGEPALKNLPADLAEELRKLIDDIADRLAIQPCYFAGHFCITAAWVLGERARTVSEVAAEDTGGLLDPPKHTKVAGTLDFTSTATPAIQYLRHLADVVSRITHLARRIDAAYRANAKQISGFREGSHIGWMLEFGSQFSENLVHSVSDHFIASTRTVFLQLLHTSRVNIRQRLDKKVFPSYAAFFEQLVRSELLQQDELQQLYTTLANETQGVGTKAARYALDAWRNIPHTWHEARQQLTDLFALQDPFPVAIGGGSAGTPVYVPGMPVRIKDSKDHVWTLEQLERAIALRSDTAKQIDPVMSQVIADAKLKARFVNQPNRIREELEALLEEMESSNTNVTKRVAEDEHYAFGLAPIDDRYSSDRPQTVPGTGFILQGVHRLAHETVSEFFRGDVYYNMGVRLAMRTEDTRRWLKEVVAFAIPLVLFIVCEPLGIIAGAAFALEAREEAAEKIEAYRGLIDPDLVFDYAQLEADLFATDIGVALSFIPVPGLGRTASKIGARAGLSLLKGEVRAAGGIIIRSVHRVLTKAMLKAIRGNIVKAFIKQVVMTELMGIALNKMIAPVIEQIQRQHLSYEELIALAAEVHEA